MAYNPLIPQPTDQKNNSQGPILDNFIELDTFLSVDHVALNAADQGKHDTVTFPERVGNPTTAVDETILFSKLSTLSNEAEIFIRKENNGDVVEFTSSLAATPGWTRLPSGILLKWGTASGNGTTTLVFPVAGTIPVFATVYSVQITPTWGVAVDVDFATRLVDFTNLQFRSYVSNRTTIGAAAGAAKHMNYLAIGI